MWSRDFSAVMVSIDVTRTWLSSIKKQAVQLITNHQGYGNFAKVKQRVSVSV